MDAEAWHAAIDGVAKSRTRLSNWTELNDNKSRLFNHIRKMWIRKRESSMIELKMSVWTHGDKLDRWQMADWQINYMYE